MAYLDEKKGDTLLLHIDKVQTACIILDMVPYNDVVSPSFNPGPFVSAPSFSILVATFALGEAYTITTKKVVNTAQYQIGSHVFVVGQIRPKLLCYHLLIGDRKVWMIIGDDE